MIDAETMKCEIWLPGGIMIDALRMHIQSPLRKVMYRDMIAPEGSTTKILQEVLECGHFMSPKTDMYVETAPVRRRCYKCRLEATSNRRFAKVKVDA